MKLEWQDDSEPSNRRTATSGAYRYLLVPRLDGQAHLTVHHRELHHWGRPIKTFTYRNPQAAENGAQRFEDKHGFPEGTDPMNCLRAQAWDAGFKVGVAAGPLGPEEREEIPNPYRNNETTED